METNTTWLVLEKKKKSNKTSFYIYTVNFSWLFPIDSDLILSPFHSREGLRVKSYGLTTRYGFSLAEVVSRTVARGRMCHSIGVGLGGGGCFVFYVFFFRVCFSHFLGKSWSPRGGKTLTDTELSKSHEFDIVGDLRALHAGCLQRQER